jgi:hypothetical protein
MEEQDPGEHMVEDYCSFSHGHVEGVYRISGSSK